MYSTLRGFPAVDQPRKSAPMLTHPTLDQLRALKLDGMVQAFIVAGFA
jgi:hypothetical protein